MEREIERRKLNRALLAINRCNQTLLHARNEAELLDNICRIIVEIGGYVMAWVGYAEDDPLKSVRPVAHAGCEDGYLERFLISWADNEQGSGPTGTAIRTAEPCSVSNILNDPKFMLWQSEATARGYASNLSMPLKNGEKVFGALTIYASTPDAFDAEEKTLLISLAENLAYGITTLRNHEARERAEEELRQSEARYRSLFQNQHTVMLLIDPLDGNIVDANPAAASFYGWTHEELCRMNISQINQLSGTEIHAEMELARKEERNYFIFRHRLADGSLRDVEVFSGPILIQHKSLLYSIVTDFTLRKRAEEALREGERKFRTITEQIAEMVFMADGEGHLSYVSPMVEPLFGYKAQEVIGHQFFEYFADEELPRAIGILNESLQNQVTDQVLELRYRKKDGSFFYGEVHIRYYQDNDFSGMIGLIRDVTERNRHDTLRREAEIALEKSEKQFRTLFEESAAVSLILDPQTGNIVNANQAAANFYGWSIEELCCMHIRQINPIPDAAIMQNLEKGRSREQKQFVFRHKKADGSYRDVEAFSTKIEIAGKELLYAVIFDITERLLAEEQLQELNRTLEARIAEKTKELELSHQQLILQEKLASIGRLAAGIAHELNNPLHFIRINFATQKNNFDDLMLLVHEYRKMTKLVAEQAALPFTELEKIRKIESELQLDMLLDEIPEIFEESQSGFERIATIINSMRNFSYRHAPDEKVLFDINGGIRDTIVLVEHEYLDSAKIETILEELPPVNCNPEQINQVFLNLIVNSAEAILEQHREAKGNITIRTWFNQDEVGCSIADDGSGIAEELRSKIFDPFFTTKSPGKGTGLGLSISYDTIVRKHGGTLSVACPAEGGTIFTMTLPR